VVLIKLLLVNIYKDFYKNYKECLNVLTKHYAGKLVKTRKLTADIYHIWLDVLRNYHGTKNGYNQVGSQVYL